MPILRALLISPSLSLGLGYLGLRVCISMLSETSYDNIAAYLLFLSLSKQFALTFLIFLSNFHPCWLFPLSIFISEPSVFLDLDEPRFRPFFFCRASIMILFNEVLMLLLFFLDELRFFLLRKLYPLLILFSDLLLEVLSLLRLTDRLLAMLAQLQDPIRALQSQSSLQNLIRLPLLLKPLVQVPFVGILALLSLSVLRVCSCREWLPFLSRDPRCFCDASSTLSQSIFTCFLAFFLMTLPPFFQMVRPLPILIPCRCRNLDSLTPL